MNSSNGEPESPAMTLQPWAIPDRLAKKPEKLHFKLAVMMWRRCLL